MLQLQCAGNSYPSCFLALCGIYLLLPIPSVNLLAHSLVCILANSETFLLVPCFNCVLMQFVPIQTSRVKALSISRIPCSITCSKFFNDSTLLLEWTPNSLLWLSQLWPVPWQGLSSIMAGVLQLGHLGSNLSASWIVPRRWTPPHVALSSHRLL